MATVGLWASVGHSKDTSMPMQWLKAQQKPSTRESHGSTSGPQEHAMPREADMVGVGTGDNSPLSDHSSQRTQSSNGRGDPVFAIGANGKANTRPLKSLEAPGWDGQSELTRRAVVRPESMPPVQRHAGEEPKLAHRFCPWDGTEFRALDVKCPVCGSERRRSPYSGKGEVLQRLLLPAWERVLWKRQPYLDNYTDRTFLESLITNANFSEYDFWRIVRDSVVVAQHLSATVIFLAMFYLTNYNNVQLRWMLFVDVLLGAAGFGAMILTCLYQRWRESGLPSWTAFLVKTGKGVTFETAVFVSAKYIRACFLFLTAIYTLSPILRTLTQTISNDTVAAMTISFLSVHLFSHDYRFVNGRDTAFEGSVALNAAMFVSVLLTSRSASNLHVALLMCCAVEIFALAPRVFRQIRLTSETASVTATVLFFVFALVLLQYLNALLAWIFALSVFSIAFVAPLTFMYIQRYKNKINGPWDEAVPTNKNNKMGQ
mmetsp:Transcript_61882/g.152378  ORF Transcript_61882/g.152378 Transcript_61882/m.152378 type:complete len:487 (-) Transcript_61882:755-2215(-)